MVTVVTVRIHHITMTIDLTITDTVARILTTVGLGGKMRVPSPHLLFLSGEGTYVAPLTHPM